MPQGQYPLFPQELISEHFGEDGTSYETEIQELEDLRQVGGLLPSPHLVAPETDRRGRRERRLGPSVEVHMDSLHGGRKPRR